MSDEKTVAAIRDILIASDAVREEKIFIASWQEAHTIVDDAMKKGDRSVSIYISPNGGMSISVYPWPDEETLRAAYEQGKISYNDYRTKIGLCAVKP